MEEIDDDGELSEENIINVIDNNNSINNLNQDLSLNDKNNKNKIIEKLAEKININPLNLTSYNFAKYNLSYETI
jgi:hypothetical protein